jgi:hypothetical protein
MAGDSDSTSASPCASAPASACTQIPQALQSPDLIPLLLDMLERQTAGWEAMPEDNDLRDKVAALTWDETGALLRRCAPTTLHGVARALRHTIERIAEDDGGGPDDYTIPLARNAVTALEGMIGR